MMTQTLPNRSESALLSPKHILVPSDFSNACDNAFKYAMRFAQQFDAELHVIHVVEMILAPELANLPGNGALLKGELVAASKSLHAWARSSGAMGIRTNVILRNGLPAHEIVEAAKDLDADLIVMATHGHTGWKHFCIGSTAERVVRAAPCSVLIVREKEHQFV